MQNHLPSRHLALIPLHSVQILYFGSVHPCTVELLYHLFRGVHLQPEQDALVGHNHQLCYNSILQVEDFDDTRAVQPGRVDDTVLMFGIAGASAGVKDQLGDPINAETAFVKDAAVENGQL